MSSSFDPSQVPSAPPPPGQSPNLAIPVYDPGPIAGANGVMLFVATVAFLARMFTMEFVIKKVYLEDCDFASRHPSKGCVDHIGRSLVSRLGMKRASRGLHMST